MLPWMIEELKRKERSQRDNRIPLHAPLHNPHLTGSVEQVKKKERRGSVEIDYSL